MISLAQKLKMPKTCKKRLYKHIKVVLCKKGSNKQVILEKRDHFKNWPKMATKQRLKPLQNGQFGSKIKNA